MHEVFDDDTAKSEWDRTYQKDKWEIGLVLSWFLTVVWDEHTIWADVPTCQDTGEGEEYIKRKMLVHLY